MINAYILNEWKTNQGRLSVKIKTIYLLCIFILSAGVHCSDDDFTPAPDLSSLLNRMKLDQYTDVSYTMMEVGENGWDSYYYSLEDCKCINGDEFRILVLDQGSDNVMFFMEGGGAEWPGGGFSVQLTITDEISFKSTVDNNPLKDWNMIYVPYCDGSIHTGDNQLEYDGQMHYFWGMRNTSAGVALLRDLFPDPEKILVSGSSAGGFGTFIGWAIVKSQYLNTKTYILNDSGVGFWNPDDIETWNIIKDTWKIEQFIPRECSLCEGPVLTYLYQTFMDYDPQLRIGLFSSYRDGIISEFFLGMDSNDFKQQLLTITDNIHQAYPDRFKRFLIDTNTHTTYEILLPQGPNYEINGTSMFEWIGHLVNDDPSWQDLLE